MRVDKPTSAGLPESHTSRRRPRQLAFGSCLGAKVENTNTLGRAATISISSRLKVIPQESSFDTCVVQVPQTFPTFARLFTGLITTLPRAFMVFTWGPCFAPPPVRSGALCHLLGDCTCVLPAPDWAHVRQRYPGCCCCCGCPS